MGGPDSKSKVTRSFPKSRRLKRSGDFARLKTEGQRQVCGSLVFNWQARPLDPELAPVEDAARQRAILARTRLGVVTSRRIGDAVTRNRARRLLREAFRLHQAELQQPIFLVLVARPSIARRDFAAVERDFMQCLRRSGLTQLPTIMVPATPALAATSPTS